MGSLETSNILKLSRNAHSLVLSYSWSTELVMQTKQRSLFNKFSRWFRYLPPFLPPSFLSCPPFHLPSRIYVWSGHQDGSEQPLLNQCLLHLCPTCPTCLFQAPADHCSSFKSEHLHYGFPRWCSGKESACQCKRDVGSIPGWGNGNPLQYPCLENSMDRRVWRVTVHGVAE